MGAARGKVGAEAIAPDVLHALLVGEWRYGASNIVLGERLVEIYKVRKAAADGRDGFLKGRKSGLNREQDGTAKGTGLPLSVSRGDTV